MGHRSFLTELLVLLLAAALGWPGWTCGAPSSSSKATSVRSRAVDRQACILGRSRQVKPVPEHDPLTRPAGLDDDPAIPADSSEEWIEGSTGLSLPASVESGCGIFATTAPYSGLIVTSGQVMLRHRSAVQLSMLTR